MSWRDKLQQYILGKMPEDKIRVEAEMRSDSSGLKIPSKQIKRSSQIFEPKSYRDWKDAIAMATNPDEPTFTFLAELYDNLLLDAHLSAVIESRIMRVIRSRFIIRKPDGEEIPELTKLFQRPWFEQFVKYALMSKFTGVKVLELYELDDNLELVKTTSIPMGYIQPWNKKIILEPGSNEGYYYDRPPVDKFYLQIGEDNQLGILSQIAPLVLAKKLSMGSWLDYIEKFGIAPRTITTNNKTEKRAKELLDMAMKMISNHVAVLREGEKLEIGNVPSTDTYKVFDEMIKRINSEISKRILGQDATTETKSNTGTYGSMKIMQEVANDRHESDKLFIQYIVNKSLIPKLTQISSAYADLDGKEFDWDETETMTNAELLDRVVSLSQAGFEIDHQAIAEKTGIPIIGRKTTEGQPADVDGIKKKTLTPKQ